MRIRQLHLLALAAMAAASIALAQTPPAQQQVIRGQDGGAVGRMESIFIPPKPGAPFSLTLDT
ncbi:MAG: hypothetical protein ABSF53_13475 [Terracidiphilus sp.]|jgi:hypothetical protein